MSRYRKIEVRTWSDEAFRELSPLQPSGQGLWLYLLTGPQTGPIPGLYRAGRAAMAEELDWPLDAFYDKFAELESRGMARADWKARLVWLPNALKHNKPESPNVVRSWRTELDLLPECALKREALVQIRQTLADMGPSYLKAFEEVSGDTQPEALPKALPEALPQSLSESGTGTGTGTGNPAAAGAQLAGPDPAPEAAPAPAAPGQTGHSAGELSAVMRRHGVKANPGHPDLIALAAQGVSPETVQAACEEARRAKPDEAIGMVYVLGILKRWKADAAKLDLAGVSAPRPAGGAWWASDASILAKGMELGLAPRAGESMPTFKGRIELAIGGHAPPPSPSRTIAPAVIETRGKKPEGLDLKALLRQATARGP